MIGNFKSLEDFNLKNKKIFISQPMKGKSETTIRKEREFVISEITRLGGTVIDSVIQGYEKYTAAQCIGKSIVMMAEADLVLFFPGYEEARGCKVEMSVCKEYDIDYIVL